MVSANPLDMTIEQIIGRKAKIDAFYAIAYALLEVAAAQRETAREINHLGVADAATPMGAIEVLADQVRRIADATNEWVSL
jgi:hypothetical protein